MRLWKLHSRNILAAVDQGLGPSYFFSFREVRGLFRPFSAAIAGFTSLRLCFDLRQLIRDWQGPGFCCAVRAAGRVPPILATVLHEYCHFHSQRGPEILPLLTAAVADPASAPELARTSAKLVAPSTGEDADRMHGAAFLRMVCHVEWRARFLAPLRLEDYVGAWHRSYLSDPRCYRHYLGEEPRRLAGVPLAEVAAADPPAEFAAFAAWDRERSSRLRKADASKADHS